MILPAILLGLGLQTAPYAADGTVTLAPGFYPFDALAARLSTETRSVAAARSLRGRAVYLAAGSLTRADLLAVLRATSGIALESGGVGRSDRLIPDPAELRREQADRAAILDDLRRRVIEIRDEAENLRRDGETSEGVIARADRLLHSVAIPREGTEARARVADAYAEAETLLWEGLTLDEGPQPQARVASIHAFTLLPTLTGTALSGGANVRRTEAAAIARAHGVGAAELAPLAGDEWLQTRWIFRREPGRLSLSPRAQWIDADGGPSPVGLSTAAFLPWGAQEAAGLGLATALYVGVPGSKRCGALLSSASQTRYAALEASTRDLLATDVGASWTAFTRAGASSFSRRMAAWARESRTPVAFELDVLGDAPDRFREAAGLPSFSEWRLSRVAGVIVANNLLDAVDRAFPVDAAALAPLISAREAGPAPLAEDEARAYFKAAGTSPDLPEDLANGAFGIPIGALRGGAAFLAYEAVRKRPEVAAVLNRGTGRITIPLATLGDTRVRTVFEAMGRDPFSTLRLNENAFLALRSSSIVLSVAPSETGAGPKAGPMSTVNVQIRAGRDTLRDYGLNLGLQTGIAFMRPLAGRSSPVDLTR